VRVLSAAGAVESIAPMKLRGEPLNDSDYAHLKERRIDRKMADQSLLKRVDSIEYAEILGLKGPQL
jgi:hypothetical protein